MRAIRDSMRQLTIALPALACSIVTFFPSCIPTIVCIFQNSGVNPSHSISKAAQCGSSLKRIHWAKCQAPKMVKVVSHRGKSVFCLLLRQVTPEWWQAETLLSEAEARLVSHNKAPWESI
jgi:hypothetical protein